MRQFLSVPAVAVLVVPFFCQAAPEEIQVYMDEINPPGRFGLEVHNNFVLSGNGIPGYPGAVPPVHVYRLTPELSYGLTDTLELGAYFLGSYGKSAAYGGEKLRLKYIAPKGAGQSLFWGTNLEVGKILPAVDQNPWNAELKGILGYRIGPWTLAVNANLAWTISGPAPLPPSLEIDTKAAYATGLGYDIGFESYNGIGPVRRLGYMNQQSQTLYGVVDASRGGWDLNLGIGRGLNGSSDRWIAKAIVGIPFE